MKEIQLLIYNNLSCLERCMSIFFFLEDIKRWLDQCFVISLSIIESILCLTRLLEMLLTGVLFILAKMTGS